jgi:hypothetical protein
MRLSSLWTKDYPSILCISALPYPCEIWGSNSGTAEDLSILRCYTMSLTKEFPTVKSSVVPFETQRTIYITKHNIPKTLIFIAKSHKNHIRYSESVLCSLNKLVVKTTVPFSWLGNWIMSSNSVQQPKTVSVNRSNPPFPVRQDLQVHVCKQWNTSKAKFNRI